MNLKISNFNDALRRIKINNFVHEIVIVPETQILELKCFSERTEIMDHPSTFTL